MRVVTVGGMTGVAAGRGVGAGPTFATESERDVWDRLTATAPGDWVILPNVRITDSADREADLVVLIPGQGVVVCEVKGGSLFHRDGDWWVYSQGRDRKVRPVDQARETAYALRAYVEADPRWRALHGSRIRFAHTVIAPYSEIADDFATPDCPRWAIHGKGDLADLAGRLWDLPARQDNAYRLATEQDCELVAQILAGRSLPQRDVVAAADERQHVAERLSEEQAQLLRVTRLLHRVEVRGGAGSGKTVLALAQARDLTRGSDERPPQRVALLCYSIGLASYFTRYLRGFPKKQRPAFVGTFEDLAAYLGVTGFGTREDTAFWEETLPERMAELAVALPDARRFDALVVDEAQDFADLWWRPLMRCLRDPDEGGVFVYSDEHQRVFPRFGRPPVPLVPLVLDHNLRNTRQIADVFMPLAPSRMYAAGGEGVDVSFVPAPADDVVETADDQVEALLDEGWRPQDIALLTTGSRHTEQVNLQELHGQAGYWKSFWDAETVFYGHVLGCKGLERRCVVLAVNGGAHERARERLYVGLSRATDRLVVVGDPAVVRAIGGDTVADRLGLTN